MLLHSYKCLAADNSSHVVLQLVISFPPLGRRDHGFRCMDICPHFLYLLTCQTPKDQQRLNMILKKKYIPSAGRIQSACHTTHAVNPYPANVENMVS